MSDNVEKMSDSESYEIGIQQQELEQKEVEAEEIRSNALGLRFQDKDPNVSDEEVEKSENGFNQLDVVEGRISQIIGLVGLPEKEVFNILRTYKQTYIDLIPFRFRTANWQQGSFESTTQPGTFNNALKLNRVDVIGSNVKARGGNLPFNLALDSDIDNLTGTYKLNDSMIAIAGDNGKVVEINPKDRPLLNHFLSLTVLRAYVASLIRSGHIRSEVVTHQMNRVFDYRIKSNKHALISGIFDNEFPPVYLLTNSNLGEVEKEIESSAERLEEYTNDLKRQIPQHTQDITKFFDTDSLRVETDFLDGIDEIEFKKDPDSNEIIFRLLSGNHVQSITGSVTKRGVVTDFDLDLSQYPTIDGVVKNLILTKYLEGLGRRGILDVDPKINDAYLEERLGLNLQDPNQAHKLTENVENQSDETRTSETTNTDEGHDPFLDDYEMRTEFQEFMLSGIDLEQFNDYFGTFKRRLWFDIPARYKNTKWMSEGREYSTIKESDKRIGGETMTYSFTKDPETGYISFVRTTDRYGADPQLQLDQNGNFVNASFNRGRFPRVALLDEVSAIDAYLTMLSENGEYRISESTTRSIEALKRSNPGIINRVVELNNDPEILRKFTEHYQTTHDQVPAGTFDEIMAEVEEDQKEGEDVRRLTNFMGFAEYILAKPEMAGFNEYAQGIKRRIWLDLGQRFKNSRWMKEGQIYASAEYTAHLMHEQNADVTYLFSKDKDTNLVALVRTDGKVGPDPRLFIEPDGTISGIGIDREKFPRATALYETLALEAYSVTLEQIGETRMSDSTRRFIEKLRNEHHDDIELYTRLWANDDLYKEYNFSLENNSEEKFLNIPVENGSIGSFESVKERFDSIINSLPPEQRNQITELADEVRRGMWDLLPQKLKEDPELSEFDNVITVPIFNPELKQFVEPFDTFVIGKDNMLGYFLGFSSKDLKSHIHFWQKPDGDMEFTSENLQSDGLTVAKYAAFALYVDAMRSRGFFDDSIFPEELKTKEEELTTLFYNAIDLSKLSTPSVSIENTNEEETEIKKDLEYLKEDVERQFIVLESYYERMPEMSDLSDTIRRRFWLDIPQRYRTNRWMGDEAFLDESNTFTRDSDMQISKDFRFMKGPENSISVEYTSVSPNGEQTLIRGVLNVDGTVDFEGIDKTKFPHYTKVESDTVVEKYFSALHAHGFALQSDSLSRSIDTFTRRKQDILEKAKNETQDDLPHPLLENTTQLFLEHGDFLWEQIPQEYRSGRWLVSKGEQKGIVAFARAMTEVSFRASKDGENIEYSYDIPLHDGKKFTAFGTITLDGQVLGPTGPISESVSRQSVRVKVLDSLYSNLVEKHIVIQTPEVKAVREKFYLDQVKLKSDAANSLSSEPIKPERTVSQPTETVRHIIQRVFPFVSDDKRETVYYELNRMRRSIWSNTPARYRTSGWMQEGKAYVDGYDLDVDGPHDKRYVGTKFTFRKDPDGKIKGSVSSFGEIADFYIDRDGNVEIPGVNLDEIGSEIESFNQLTLEAYGAVLVRDGGINLGDSTNRSLQRGEKIIQDLQRSSQDLLTAKAVNFPLFYRTDTSQFVSLKDIEVKPEKEEEVHKFLREARRRLWGFVPDENKSPNSIPDSKILYYNPGVNVQDPYNGSLFSVFRHTGATSMNFDFTFDGTLFVGEIFPDGNIYTRGIDPSKNPVGYELVNTSILQWYLGLLEKEGKVHKTPEFTSFWDEYQARRNEILQDSLILFDPTEKAEQVTGDVQPQNAPTSNPQEPISKQLERRKRVNLKEAAKELDEVFERVLQQEGAMGTINL